MPEVKEALCWTCKLSGKSVCSWDKELKPVNGWKAETSKWRDSKRKKNFQNYKVIECPMYDKE